MEECENSYKKIIKDIRDVSDLDFKNKNIEAVIHLAGLSNDPLGELSPHLTEDINYLSTIKIAKIAKINGVKRFIYASTQSLYQSDTNTELEEIQVLKSNYCLCQN